MKKIDNRSRFNTKKGSTKVSGRNSRVSRVASKQQIKRQSGQRILTIVLFTITLLALMGVGSYFVFAKQFQLKSLAVVTADEALATRVTKDLQKNLKGRTYLIPNTSQVWWTKNHVNNILINEQDGIKDLNLDIADQELRVTIKQFEPLALWCPTLEPVIQTKKNCLGINSDGIAFTVNDRSVNSKEFKSTKSTNEQLKDNQDQGDRDLPLITISDDKLVTAVSGSTIIMPDILNRLIDLREELWSENLLFDSILIEPNRVTLLLSNENNTLKSNIKLESIVLPTENPARLNLAIKDLMLLLETNELSAIAEREAIVAFEYIDFITLNKVFYRFRKQ